MILQQNNFARIHSIYQAVTTAEWVNVSINNWPMLKVEGSSLGTSILEFDLFQFSQWLPLDKNNNLGISVMLLVLNDWTSNNAKSYSE